MILGDGENTFEIVAAPVNPSGDSVTGDVAVVVRVRCRGFAGETNAWILRAAWQEPHASEH